MTFLHGATRNLKCAPEYKRNHDVSIIKTSPATIETALFWVFAEGEYAAKPRSTQEMKISTTKMLTRPKTKKTCIRNICVEAIDCLRDTGRGRFRDRY